MLSVVRLLLTHVPFFRFYIHLQKILISVVNYFFCARCELAIIRWHTVEKIEQIAKLCKNIEKLKDKRFSVYLMLRRMEIDLK